MTEVQRIQQERTGIYHDLYNNKIPKRVPVDINLTFEFQALASGLNLNEVLWNPSLMENAVDYICQTVYADKCPFGGTQRYPSFYEILKSQSFKQASNGFIQHPEVVGMEPDEYDYLIEKPYDCILEKIIPRQYKGITLEDPINTAMNMSKSMLVQQNDRIQSDIIINKMVEKYGYFPGSRYSGGMTSAPFDFIADQLRGFKGISMDVRRIPDKIAAACDAIYPIVLKRGMPQQVSNYSDVFIPLHMPTFMREKDFAKLWWPSFKRMLEEYASMGVHCRIFCEDDWTRYLDYLYELPTDTRIMFEYGDLKLIKEKLGKKHIIMGMYPLMNLKTKSKEECIEEVKRHIDVLAPGGKYIFSLDKSPLFYTDVKMECLCAITETVRDYAVYGNAGEISGMKFNKGDYKVIPSGDVKSNYYNTWEQYKELNPEVSVFGQQKIQVLEETMFKFITSLLV